MNVVTWLFQSVHWSEMGWTDSEISLQLQADLGTEAPHSAKINYQQ